MGGALAVACACDVLATTLELPGGGTRILTLGGAPLQASSGHVLVFDDITTLVQAQREAAWSEVARRIAHVEARLALNPLLRRKLVRVPLELDYPYWVEDEHFDLEYHMRHGRLPEPGDWRQFCIHMSRYHSRPLDMSKPLWEIYVVEGLDNIEGLPPGCYAVAIKVHHAAVDGASLMRFLLWRTAPVPACGTWPGARQAIICARRCALPTPC